MSHRVASVWLIALVVALLAPFLARGEVVFPHDNTAEMGFGDNLEATDPENPKFSDQALVYIPELHHQLRGDQSGWISTWNPHPELGRPTTQISGFSKAFLLTHVLSWLTDDAFVLYTWLAVAALLLTALFGYLLCAELELRPAACLLAGAGFALGVFSLYWLTFLMFLWGVCWTLALLWLVTLVLRPDASGRARLLGGLGIAFGVHALFLTGYPQQIVWHGYLLVGYALWRLWSSSGIRADGLGRLRTAGPRALEIAGAVALGLISIAPVYLDLAQQAGASARLSAEPAFFLEVLPEIDGWRGLLRFVTLIVDAFWFGHPIEPDYPFRFSGWCLTPLGAGLLAVALRPTLVRRLWPVHVFVGLAVAATLSGAVYTVGIRHLGLGLSRYQPLAGAIVPAVLLTAYAADDVLRNDRSAHGRWIDLALAALVWLFALIGWTISSDDGPGPFLWIGAAFAAATAVFLWTGKPLVLVLLVTASTFHYGARLPLFRPRDGIRTTSPFVELLAQETREGSRFAWVGGGKSDVLPANQEALVGLRSIHTYNSLSSANYQAWVEEISEVGATIQGRHFPSIYSDALLSKPPFSFAGVGVLLSRRPLNGAERIGGIAYRLPRVPPILEAQLAAFEAGASVRQAEVAGHLLDAPRLGVKRIENKDDRLLFEVTQSPEDTLLFVSQEHHPFWRARSADGTKLQTVLVNDFFQGVRLPPGTGTVELRFLPWVRWSWLPQLGFPLAFLLVGYWTLRRKR